jgi:hypothetical protein
MDPIKSDPLTAKMVAETPEFVKSRIIAELIVSHGSHAKHRICNRFVIIQGDQPWPMYFPMECAQIDMLRKQTYFDLYPKSYKLKFAQNENTLG